jgi:predicted dehydrogenase
VRLIQVGLGPHGRNWAKRVIPSIQGVDLVGYVDTDPKALDILRDEADIPAERCFESMTEAIAQTLPDAVLITTALPGHAPVIRASLEAGLHVLVEKPFAPKLAIAQELVDQAADAGLIIMVSQNYRFFPAPRALAALVREASLGKLFQVSIDFRRYSVAGPNGRGRHHLEEQPLLVDMSIHHFDLLRLILDGEPERVYCEAWNPDWTAFIGPSVAVGSMNFSNGVVVSYRGSWVSAGPITPWAGDWRLEFERGEILWTNKDDDVANDRVTVRPHDGRAHNVSLQPMEWTGPWGTLTEFALAIEQGRQPETSGRDNLGTIAFMDAMVDSAARHEPMSVAPTEVEQAGKAVAS